jgi:allantoin racemase
MIRDPAAVGRDAHARCTEVMAADGAETVILGCTIIAACYELRVLAGDPELEPAAIINPNLMAVKSAELLADLHRAGQYRISRSGYYQRHAQHDAAEAEEVLELLLGRATSRARPGAR